MKQKSNIALESDMIALARRVEVLEKRLTALGDLVRILSEEADKRQAQEETRK